jgi:hypothetical protein
MKNRDFVLTSVTQNGDSLQHASDELKDDSAVVSEAVNKPGNALLHSSDCVKNNCELVLTAFF